MKHFKTKKEHHLDKLNVAEEKVSFFNYKFKLSKLNTLAQHMYEFHATN